MTDPRAIERIGAVCLAVGAAAWCWAFFASQSPSSPWNLPGAPRAVELLATRAMLTGLVCYALAPRLKAAPRALWWSAALGAALSLGADAATAWTGWLGVQVRDARDGARVILAARVLGGVAQLAALAMALRASRGAAGPTAA